MLCRSRLKPPPPRPPPTHAPSFTRPPAAMDALDKQLLDSVVDDNVAALQAALAAGANPNATYLQMPLLKVASVLRHLECLRALLQAGADPEAADVAGQVPLQWAAAAGNALVVAALLAAGADPAVVDHAGRCALHGAVRCGSKAATLALLAAAPQLALLRDSSGSRPFDVALENHQYSAALFLMEHAPLPPAAELLASLEAAHDRGAVPARLHALYVVLLALQPLTPAEWARVPAPCTGLGAALPAVLARSEAEAALLVAHLPAADRQRLRTAALCLRRTERVHGVDLPPALLRALLLAAVE